MALSKFEKDMQIIQALDDEPNDVGGLTSADLKAAFDEGGEALKAFLNGVLIPALDTYIARTDNPHAVTKGQVGLGNCDNTADADKPVSAAQLAAIAGVVLGQIPDASLTMAKMAPSVAALFHNRNLLDNWDFRNAVNQRGATSWSNSYGIDRWLLSADNSTATFIAGTGIILNNEFGNCFFTQLFEKSLSINTVYTLSVMLADGSVKSFTHIANGEYSVVDGIFFGIGFGGSSQIAFGPIEGNAITVQAAKLERGSVSTLANDPPADYGEELRKCQRYYETIPGFRFYIGARSPWSIATQTNKIPFKVTKRTIPVVTFEYEKSSNPGVWVAATASHPDTDGFTDYNTAFDCDYVGFGNVVATAEM